MAFIVLIGHQPTIWLAVRQVARLNGKPILGLMTLGMFIVLKVMMAAYGAASNDAFLVGVASFGAVVFTVLWAFCCWYVARDIYRDWQSARPLRRGQPT